MSKSLTYIEIDVDFCQNVYGNSPCNAAILGGFFTASGLGFGFQNSSVDGFTGANADLTAEGSSVLLTPTGNDPFLRRTGLSIAGATNYLVQIDVERVTARSGAAIWQGNFFFVNGSHGESASFFESFAETGLERVGDRRVIQLDLSSLTVGGTDWITGTTTAIRFDFDDAQSGGSAGTFRIHSVSIGHPASADEATGTAKCFNSLSTCQDRVNFTNDPVTLRYAIDTGYLPKSIDCIPNVIEASLQPAVISLGQDLGQRGTLTVTFRDHKHNDQGTGYDKYVNERPYDPWTQGTYWGKFRARQPFLKGRAIRLIRGYVGDELAAMETRHYIIESFTGPSPQGQYTLVAQDVLKLADGDRAQAPVLSNGFLVGAIDDNDLSLTLSPSGIGNAEYPTSGLAAIGGEEIVSFTRSGDVMTIVRAQEGTTAAAHDVQDRVQIVLKYDGEDPADIIYDLLVNYAFIPAAYITLATWQDETGSFLQRLYGAVIPEPTDVRKLVSELIEQAALAMWWDDEAQQIRMQVLRAISTDAATFDEDNTLEGTLSVVDQPTQRVSQVWTYYGQRNPLRPLDESDNFRSTLASVNLQAETDEGQAAIRKIFSRWIPAFGRDTAERLNDIVLGRFQVAPRRFTFDVLRDSVADPQLGGGYQVGSWSIQDAFGAPDLAPIQITRVNPMADRFQVEAEEMLFEPLDPADLINRTIIIDSNSTSLNLRTIHDGIYPAPTVGESPSINVTCIITAGVIVGSTGATTPAFDIGSWPAGVAIHLQVDGDIRGAGGDGGGDSSPNGETGGTALYTRYGITMTDTAGKIYGGGGGGGRGRGTSSFPVTDVRGGGGGGAGVFPGDGGVVTGGTDHEDGSPGLQDTGGAGGSPTAIHGGTGGTPGTAGASGNGNAASVGGAAGNAIDGISFITVIGAAGSRLGGQVN